MGSHAQLFHVTATLLLALVNHEYQHDCWIGEVRSGLGHAAPGAPASTRVVELCGYWTLTTTSRR